MDIRVQREKSSNSERTNDLTAKMFCSVDNNFNLTRYNSIKIIGNDKGEQKMLAVHNSSVLGKYGQLNH
jgi:anthranilate/para-aminobenzoate synthase component II